MSRSGNEFIAQTQGAQFTLYAVMRMLDIPLSEEQEKFQRYLEKKYDNREVVLSQKEEQPKAG